MKQLNQLLEEMRQEKRPLLRCGSPTLDSMGLLHEGAMTLLGARPGMGKTTLAMQIAGHVANEEERIVLWFCDWEHAAYRIAREIPNIRYWFAPQHLWLEDREWNMKEIRKLAQEAPQPPALIVLDSLQGFYVPLYDAKRVCAEAREIARETGAAVLLTSKLTREVEGRKGHAPRPTDVLQWEAIAPFLDTVCLFLHDGYYDDQAPDPTRTRFSVSTIPNGYRECGNARFDLRYNRETRLYYEIGYEDFWA